MKKVELNNVWRHLLLWVILYGIVFITLSTFLDSWGAFTRTAQIIITHGIIFYSNMFYFLPRFFEMKRYGWYFFLVLSLIAFLTWFLYSGNIFSLELPEKFHDTQNLIRNFRNGAPNLRIVRQGTMMFGTLFLSMILRSISERQRKDRLEINLENKLLEAETKMLKSQLNPHFLFNALNNIYSLAQSKSDKTPEFVHKLSMLLSYVLYESDTERVLLEKEIKYIQSFVEFQLLKDDQLSNVYLDIDNIDLNKEIAPLLLIAFIENCFKHSHFEKGGENGISIRIRTEESKLFFHCENSIPKVGHEKTALVGIGLENVKKRLELIYPERHELTIVKGELMYSVELMIELDEN